MTTHPPAPDHTQGKASYRIDRHDHVLSVGVQVVVRMYEAPDKQSNDEIAADMRRLAACWNALDGVHDPEGFVAAAVKPCEATTLAAGERAHGFHCNTKSGGECNCAVGLALAALALATTNGEPR